MGKYADQLDSYQIPNSEGASPGYNKGKKTGGSFEPGHKPSSACKGFDKSKMGDGRTPSKKRTKPM